MSAELCNNCPLLRTAAEEERLLQAGIEREGRSFDSPVEAILVGRLRREYGCRGPRRRGECRWQPWRGGSLRLRDDVPLLNGYASRGQGQYL